MSPTPSWIPIRGSSQPPIKAPIIPTTRSPRTPNPVPRTMWPANQADEQDHKETFTRHIHALRRGSVFLQIHPDLADPVGVMNSCGVPRQNYLFNSGNYLCPPSRQKT
jgi:hypothetical protein